MQNSIIEKLFTSLSELETAIENAKNTLARTDKLTPAISARLNSYNEILTKQRKIAGDLCVFIIQKNWKEVDRNVNLINGLSAMIRDDAHSILSSITLDSNHQECREYTCC